MKQNYGTSFESPKNLKSPEFRFQPKFTGPYGRVSELVYEALVSEVATQKGWGNQKELLVKIAEKLNDIDFKMKVQAIWDDQTTKGHIKNDPEEQERLWARGLIERIKEEPFFNQ